jgi:hypothetical protein
VTPAPLEVTPDGRKAANAVCEDDLVDETVTGSPICFEVGRPNPSVPDLDSNFVTSDEVSHMMEQGRMINGSVTMCCLNLLIHETCKSLGARREQDTFVPAIMSRNCDL